MHYQFDWPIVIAPQTIEIVLAGVKLTLLISALALVFGSLIGIVTAVARLSRRAPLPQAAYVYVDLFRTTPPLVQLIWIYYVGPLLLGINLSAVAAGIAALSLNSGAFLSEVFRAGLQSIDPGQHDAARVIGLSRWQAFRTVILPQALRRVAPATANIFMSLLKDSSLLSVIGVTELTYGLQSEVAQTFRPFELYTALAVIYLVLTYPISVLTTILERRYKGL